MEPVGRRRSRGGLRGQPLTEAEGREEPGAHPHFRLVANAGEAGRGQHEWYQTSGRLRRVENHQVPVHLSVFPPRTDTPGTA